MSTSKFTDNTILHSNCFIPRTCDCSCQIGSSMDHEVAQPRLAYSDVTSSERDNKRALPGELPYLKAGSSSFRIRPRPLSSINFQALLLKHRSGSAASHYVLPNWPRFPHRYPHKRLRHVPVNYVHGQHQKVRVKGRESSRVE